MSMRLIAKTLTVLSMFSCLTLHGAEASKPMKITTIEGISEYRLENGLRVLLFPDPSKSTVTVCLTVFVGSRHEGYGEAGMAHLLEHMVFKGTPDHPKIPKELQSHGAVYNGTTSFDRTNYYETLPATDENLEFAISLEADRMINSYIKSEDLASEMTVVRNEFERNENNPHYILGQRMMNAAYSWHNYGKTTIGNRADIERVPIESLREFYKKYYQPNNAMVVVAGRFEEAKALNYLNKYFGAIPRPEAALPQTYTEEPSQDGERSVHLLRVGEVSLVGALYHIPAGGHPDFVPIDVLEAILTMAPSGRLYKSLVETRKAASVSGGAWSLHDPGVLRFMAEVTTGNSPEVVLDEMLDTIQSVVDQGVKDEEVERARQRLIKQREQVDSDSQTLAIQLSSWAAQGDWRLYFIYRDRLEQVTAKDVSRVARTYLQSSNRTVGIYFPTKEPQRTAIPESPDLSQMIGEYKGRSDAAVGEAFDVSPANIEARTKRSTLEGIQVALLPKKTRGATVVLRLNLRYGDERSLFGLGKACDFLPLMMNKGTKQLTRQQLQDQLDKNLASLIASGSPGEATFEIRTKRNNLVAAIDLLRQVVREPVFPGSELDLLKQSHRADLEQSLKEPQQLALKALRRTLNPYPVGDVRYFPTIEEELRLNDELDVATIKQIYTDFLGSHAGQLTIVGDFEEEPVMEAMSGILKGWKARQPYARIPRTGDVDVKSDLVKIATPDKANAYYFAGSVFPLRDDDPDYPALLIGNYIFGAGALSSRLGDRIRQREGLSYSVGSSVLASPLDRRATWIVQAIYNPANFDKLIMAVHEELDDFLATGIKQKELLDARRGFLQNQTVMRTDDSRLAQILELTSIANRTMSFYADLEERVSSLTPEIVRDTCRKYIDANRLFETAAGDWAAAKKAAEAAAK